MRKGCLPMDSERQPDADAPAGRPWPDHPGDSDTCWLDSLEPRLAENEFAQLTLQLRGREPVPDIRASRLFALSEPRRYISVRQADGTEIGILRDLDALPEPDRQLLARHMDRRCFIPIIQQVTAIEEFWIDQTWTVMTDRGPRRFTIQGREAIRFLSDRAFLLLDTDDNRYLLADRALLDASSRRWVDRFVW